MSIVAIDFEASCLPVHGLSFPIEVGICDGPESARSWLIRPHPRWAGWTWSREAEALHGIGFDRLMREGLPAEQVAAELIAALHGRRVIADSWLDPVWLRTLTDAAGVDMRIPVGHIEEIIDAAKASDEQVRMLVRRLDRCGLRRHRAADDARWLFGLIDGLQARPGAARAMDHPSSARQTGHGGARTLLTAA